MSHYFPFTDYDFYSYLTSGSLLLGILDFVFNDASLVGREDWTFVQIVLAVAAAYVLGHLVAWFSQLLIEMCVMRQFFTAPNRIQLGFSKPRWRERLLAYAISRGYEPFKSTHQTKIKEVAADALGCSVSELSDAEDIFPVAHGRAMGLEAVRSRSDEFRNLYGLFRNMTFVGLSATAMLGFSGWFGDGGAEAKLLTLLAVTLSIATFIRFAKFYAGFSAEILRSLLE